MDEQDQIRPQLEQRNMSAATVAAVAAVAGAGAAVYGASSAGSAQSSANASNQAAVDANNQANWNNYLLTRGVVGNSAPTGTIPTGAQAVNSKLPLWANVDISNGLPGGSNRWVKAGTPTPATNFTLSSAPVSGTGSVNGTQDNGVMNSYGQ